MKKTKLLLLIEDDEPIVDVLKRRLEKENLDLIVATDGREGLELALASHPDLILLDILMPKFDGLSMLEELRQDAWGKMARVIILTNLSDEDSEKEAAKYRVIDYVIKTDCHLEDLVKKIKKNL